MIGVCGFLATGSSAVLDYLKEFDELCVLDRDEFLLLYYPDGLEDLDYHLNVNCSKYISSTVAIERFRRALYNLYRYSGNKKTGRAMIDAGEDFIKKITQVKWTGRSNMDFQLDCPPSYKGFDHHRFGIKLLRKTIVTPLSRKLKKTVGLGLHDMEFAMNPEGFDDAAKEFIHRIEELMGADFSKEIVLNQPFCGNNPQKGFKYFDNPRAIVVDRDPRDHYLFSKRFLLNKAGPIPVESAEKYVKYYRAQRMDRGYVSDDPNVLKIRFEDMIYDYEATTEKIRKFAGLEGLKSAHRYFAPELSINNTQMFKRFPEHEEEVRYIEKELPEFLYPFEKYGDIKPDGKMFYGRSPLNKR